MLQNTDKERDSLIKKRRKKLKKAMNVNRKAVNRKLVLKKLRAEQDKYDITLFELKTKWILEDNEVEAVFQWPAP